MSDKSNDLLPGTDFVSGKFIFVVEPDCEWFIGTGMLEFVLDLLSIMLPIVITLAGAYVVKKKQLLKQEVIDGIKFLIVNVMLPALVFSIFFKAEFRLDTMVITGVMFLCWIICFSMGHVIRYIFKFEKNHFIPYMTTLAESGMVGYGFYAMLFTRERLPYLVPVDLSLALFSFTVMFPLLHKRKGLSTISSLRTYIKMPILFALTLGILISLTGLGKLLTSSLFGTFLDSLLLFLYAPMTMLILFVIGYGLDFSRERIKDALFMSVCRIIVMACFCAASLFLISSFVTLNQYVFYGIILIFSLPPVFILSVFAQNEHESAYVSTCLSLYTLITLAAFAILAVVVFSQRSAILGI